MVIKVDGGYLGKERRREEGEKGRKTVRASLR
jgi:hypothetical protein